MHVYFHAKHMHVYKHMHVFQRGSTMFHRYLERQAYMPAASVLTMRSLIFLLISMRKILTSPFNQKGEPTRIHDFILKGAHTRERLLNQVPINNIISL
jgi:hypothetical protein